MTLAEQLSPERLQELVDSVNWYHTIDWPTGHKTAGAYNHTPYLEYFGFPSSLAGKNVLGVEAADGFFSFEFERRGARDVLAIDILTYDGGLGFDPAPTYRHSYEKKYQQEALLTEQFPDVVNLLNTKGLNRLLINKQMLGSRVRFKHESIYNLATWGESYDIVFCGDLISHLKNPIEAAENLAAATRELCIIVLHTPIETRKMGHRESLFRYLAKWLNIPLESHEEIMQVHYVGGKTGGEFFHWHVKTFQSLLSVSGFSKVELYSKFRLPSQRQGCPATLRAVYHCYKKPYGETISKDTQSRNWNRICIQAI